MRLCTVLTFLVISRAVYCQNTQKPITHVEACKRFSDSVVQVDTDVFHGTGFIVDADGWILTAFHVVVDIKTLAKYGNITVTLNGDSEKIPAEIISQIDNLARTRDFAVLKIGRTKLKPLELGNEDDARVGSAISIIGIPLSAMFPENVPLPRIPQFCLTGTIAAQTSFPLGKGIHLDTVYFQGVSIKGISGAPIISLDTGKVIGIADARMTGISHSLSNLHDNIANGLGRNVLVSGLEPGTEIDKIITVLDQQLANGLGTGTGAADAAYALKKAQREYKNGNPAK
jgi:S1-C subfamily serine protease